MLSDQIMRAGLAPLLPSISDSRHRSSVKTQGETRPSGILNIRAAAKQAVKIGGERIWSDTSFALDAAPRRGPFANRSTGPRRRNGESSPVLHFGRTRRTTVVYALPHAPMGQRLCR